VQQIVTIKKLWHYAAAILLKPFETFALFPPFLARCAADSLRSGGATMSTAEAAATWGVSWTLN
jgi:hypothetical protein